MWVSVCICVASQPQLGKTAKQAIARSALFCVLFGEGLGFECQQV